MTTLVTGATGFIGGAISPSPCGSAASRSAGSCAIRARASDLGTARRRARARRRDRPTRRWRGALAGVERVIHTAPRSSATGWTPPRRAGSTSRGRAAAGSEPASRRAAASSTSSSLAVLGTCHHRGTDESAPYAYGDPYTDTKIDSERLVAARFHQPGGMETVRLRPGFMYGPGDHQVAAQADRGAGHRPVPLRRRRQQADEQRSTSTTWSSALLAAGRASGGRRPGVQSHRRRAHAAARVRHRRRPALDMPPPTRRLPVPVAFAACCDAGDDGAADARAPSRRA